MTGRIAQEETMGVLALVWGIVAFLFFVLALLPCLGWLNWLNIPFAVVGVILSIVAMAKARPGEQGPPIGGLILSLCAVVIGFLRLAMGGFIL